MTRQEDGSKELNAIRDRAGMPHVKANLSNILKERLLELVWEGWRRQDLIRFGEYTKAYDQRTPLENEFTEFTTVFPIQTSDAVLLLQFHTESPDFSGSDIPVPFCNYPVWKRSYHVWGSSEFSRNHAS